MKTLLTIAIVTGFMCSTVVAQECPSQKNLTSANTVATSVSHTQEADIVTTAVEAGSFKTLAAALGAVNLVETLKGEGPFTVFAPTDEAFAKLPAGTVDELLKPENKKKLKAILMYHVVSGKIAAGDVLKAMEVETLQGGMAPIGLTIGGANIIKTDINCTNGVIHVIDTVIMPPSK